MNHAPAISVIIPLYNKAGFIERSIRSALDQRPAPFEVLVIDDGSTDDSAARVRAMPDYPRVRLITQTNAGEGAARNRGLQEMRGEVAAFLDADDEWAPGHIRNLLELALTCPGAGLLATGYRSIYGGGVEVETAVDAGGPVVLRDYFETARGGFCLHISSAAVWRNVAEEAGGFAEREPMGADLEFFARVALRRPVALHPAISGIYYAACAGSVIHTHRWKNIYPPVVRLMRAARAGGMVLPRSARAYADWILVEHALTGLCSGNRRAAVALLGEVSGFHSLPVRSAWWLRFAAAVLPLALLRLLVRVRRSRLSVANLRGRHTVTNRVVYSHA
jgi:glycosyltransferase involved in cell wall biosynthesis